ncbi:hypothetical protein LTV02_12790 [Nocardia yamanashiensis]|uniref:hypothetical protein n=1 Tax=Nocardia yamanashiensis TaxID=209247 RepID=UPI001E62AF56|nr:hypothetical protein [Nocardia yamanashiensis]UGT44207.1 hypothetical protein LTV02_12790 [Nocardia yamanashiensis]
MRRPARTSIGTRLFAASTLVLLSSALLPALSAAPAAASPAAQLNRYCTDHGAVDQLPNGRTVYCTQVQRTDAFVWSYSRDPIPSDPNARQYTCDEQACRWPDGSFVPNYQRCGILCGEPPTSGDIQSGLYDCFSTGTDFEDCEKRIR